MSIKWFKLRMDDSDAAFLELLSKKMKLSKTGAVRMLIRAGAGEPNARSFVENTWKEDDIG